MECLPQRHGGTQRVDLEYIEDSVLLCVSVVLFLSLFVLGDRRYFYRKGRYMARVRVFEELMLAHDSRAYPCHILLRFVIAGDVNPELLARCANEVTAAHPILRAYPERVGRRLVWAIKEKAEASLRLLDNNEQIFAEPILLGQYAGWKLFLRPSTQESVLYLAFHHACVDGIGAFAVARELMETYRYLSQNEKKSGRSLASHEHEFRCGEPSFRMLLTKARKIAIGLQGIRQFLMRIPRPLIDHSPVCDERSSACEIAVLSSHFDSISTDRLVELARQNHLTLNDVLATHVFIAVQRFSKQQDGEIEHCNTWWRMMVPVSLREPGDQRISNCVSTIFLDRTPAQISDPAQLAKSIHDEMLLIKNNQLGYILPLTLWVRRWLPGGIAKGSRPTKCPTSYVFSNVGRVWTDGAIPDTNSNATCYSIKAASFVPPLAPFIHAAFSATTFDGSLTLALRYDPRFINEMAARQLLGRLVAAIHKLTQTGSFSDPPDVDEIAQTRMHVWT